jgi:general secretion pathway protein G
MTKNPPPTRPLRRDRATRAQGFTLLEIMIATAILAILASFAVAQYNGFIAESRINSAIHDIRSMELILDDLYLDNAPPATLADVGIDLVDPWGNPYHYLWLRGNPNPGVKGKRRRDKALNPVNSDYDLYSMGADGSTAAQFTAAKARDDIVRANDGAFVGLAGDH